MTKSFWFHNQCSLIITNNIVGCIYNNGRPYSLELTKTIFQVVSAQINEVLEINFACDFFICRQEVTCLDFHPHSTVLASGSADKTVKIFDYSRSSVKKAQKSIQVFSHNIIISEKYTCIPIYNNYNMHVA